MLSAQKEAEDQNEPGSSEALPTKPQEETTEGDDNGDRNEDSSENPSSSEENE